MNILMREIRKCMYGLIGTAADKRVTARFLFPSTFIGFQGHFPERPVLAGVCEIQAVKVILREWKKVPVAIKEIILAKFYSPVTCGEELLFECREREENGREAVVTTIVTGRGEKIAELRLRVSFEDEDTEGNNGGTA